MLDNDLKEQLREVFAPLQNGVELLYCETAHGSQGELLEMLTGLASVSPKLGVRSSGKSESFPQFQVYLQGRFTGITFKGIPGGHEFTSLVLAILNADGKGKLPEKNIAQRILRIKGPVRIKTYISLTCENCPDVVQALNQMALLHPDFQHEMIDGSFVPEEVAALSLQGVPAVVVGSKLIHSGRVEFLDLITKLEAVYGVQAAEGAVLDSNLGHFDVVVIGGGPAGASAAIYSARKGLKTALVAEKLGGQVQETKGIENLISVPYTEGPQLAASLRKHVDAYPVHVLELRRVQKIERHKVLLEGGEHLSGDSIIVATGAKWRELGVPGEKEYLGRGVAFCPHCDGPFYKGKKVAVIGGGNSGVEAAIDLAGIVGEVVLFEFLDELKADRVLVDKLKSLPNTSIVKSAKTKQVLGDGQKVSHLEFEDRKTGEIHKVPLDGIFVQIGLLPNSGFLKGVVELTSFGEVVIDLKNRTSAKGIYAAGDVTTVPYKQIVIAMGEGAKAALAAFEDRIHGA
ncbi:alkyl hydroperoxide reductase subunit F [Bdellovibrionota bacterium FG-2]